MNRALKIPSKIQPLLKLKRIKMPIILHLTLERKWFEMIASGEKKEEYKRITAYWEKRLFSNGHYGQPKQYDIIRFRNGYAKNAPEVDVKWMGCWVGHGEEKWGGSFLRDQYVIGLGKILSIKNYNP